MGDTQKILKERQRNCHCNLAVPWLPSRLLRQRAVNLDFGDIPNCSWYRLSWSWLFKYPSRPSTTWTATIIMTILQKKRKAKQQRQMALVVVAVCMVWWIVVRGPLSFPMIPFNSWKIHQLGLFWRGLLCGEWWNSLPKCQYRRINIDWNLFYFYWLNDWMDDWMEKEATAK